MIIVLNNDILEDQKFSFEQRGNTINYNVEYEYPDYSILPVPTSLVIKDENNNDIINIICDDENVLKTVFGNFTMIRLTQKIQ